MSAGHVHAARHAHVHAPQTFGFAFAASKGIRSIYCSSLLRRYSASSEIRLRYLQMRGITSAMCSGLLVAWGAAVLSRREPSTHYTYGLRSTSILAALFNAMFLLTAIGAIAWEALQRFDRPEPVAGKVVMAVAAVGIVINGLTAWMFASGRHSDVNIRGAFLHMAADAFVSAGVVIAGGAILLTGRHWIDPAVSLAICAIILWSTWGLPKDSVRMSLSAVPPGVDPKQVRAYLEALPGVHELHDLHIWPMSTTEIALTCHLVMPGGHPGDAFLMETAHKLHHQFGIGHTTMQTETSKESACVLAPDEVV